MLCRNRIVRIQLLSFGQIRQANVLHLRHFIRRASGILFRFFVNRHIAGERDRIAAGAEDIPFAGKVDRYRIQNRRLHLACDKPLPDQLIKLVLIV